jgi:predicted RNase H-like HicB family nuclease
MAERNYTVEIDQEADGRWIAEIPNLPGVMAYGATEQEAIANAEALASESSPTRWKSPR